MSQERIPCPDCGESIPSVAKKCRFCGAQLKPEKLPLSLQAPYLIWLTTLLIFFTLIVSLWGIGGTNSSRESQLIRFLALDVMGGSIAFLILFAKLFSKIPSKFRKRYGLLTLATLIVFFLMLSKSESVAAKLGLTTPKKSPPITTINPTPTPKIITKPTTATSTKINQIDCTGPDGKVFKTTQKECDEFNAAWNKPKPTPVDQTQINNPSYQYPKYDYGSYAPSTPTPTNTGNSTNTSNDQLEAEQKQRCLQDATAIYYHNLRSCAVYRDYYQSEKMARECETRFYQEYLVDKSECN